MRILTLPLFTLLFIVSSCKIEKRRYQPGYYIEFNGKNNYSQNNSTDNQLKTEKVEFDRNKNDEEIDNLENNNSASEVQEIKVIDNTNEGIINESISKSKINSIKDKVILINRLNDFNFEKTAADQNNIEANINQQDKNSKKNDNIVVLIIKLMIVMIIVSFLIFLITLLLFI